MAFTPLGVLIALIFIGVPFVVRTVQPVLEDLEKEIEEAAASLGANRWQTIHQGDLADVLPALLTGFTLAFARALGEYGSVVFISGNMPMGTEITPLLIITKLEQYDYTGATAIAVVMLVISFVLLLLINVLQWWSGTAQRGTDMANASEHAPPCLTVDSVRASRSTVAEPASGPLGLIAAALAFLGPVSVRAAGGGIHRSATQRRADLSRLVPRTRCARRHPAHASGGGRLPFR